MLYRIEITVCVLLVVGFLSQVLWPMYKGTKYFPLFRGYRRKLVAQLTEVREEAEAAGLEQAIKDETAHTKRLRSKKSH